MKPRISVLLPVRDAAGFVNLAVRSIVAQSFVDWELLVLDDGSTDGTPDVVARHRDSRIRIVRRNRSGLSATLIAGMAEAAGEFIARQDADDVSRPDRFKLQIAYLDAFRSVALVGSSFESVDEYGRPIAAYDRPVDHETLAAGLRQLDSPFPHSSIMFRRAEAKALGGYRGHFRKAQDFDLFLRISEHHRIASLPERLCVVRSTMSSMSSDASTGEQFRFGVLALASALARTSGGRDPLEGSGAAGFVERFDRWYAESRYPRIFASRSARKAARLDWVGGRRMRALRGLMDATSDDPAWVSRRLFPAFFHLASDVERWVREDAASGATVCAA